MVNHRARIRSMATHFLSAPPSIQMRIKNIQVEKNGCRGLATHFPSAPPSIQMRIKNIQAEKMTVKALHDGRNVFFLLEVLGEYNYV
jgi:nitrate reductase cytochrome c-type subunit